MRSAVLFLVFNRPEPTRRAFARIAAARPPRLYVAADGPRQDRPAEPALCAEVRRIATAVDWPCEITTLFREGNLGCRRAVSGAIDWFFEREEEGIIIEDDILAEPDFFRYCDELLERYREDQQVAMISGANSFGERGIAPDSYAATHWLLIWGWASWRRAWRHYSVDPRGWPGVHAQAPVARALHGDAEAFARWSRTFDAVTAGSIDTWDYQWVYAAWQAGMFAIVPRSNLVTNIGFDGDATHTVIRTPFAGRMRPAGLAFPLQHPSRLVPVPQLDRRIDDAQLGGRVLPLARRAVKRLLHRFSRRGARTAYPAPRHQGVV